VSKKDKKARKLCKNNFLSLKAQSAIKIVQIIVSKMDKNGEIWQNILNQYNSRRCVEDVAKFTG
jgi:hypothetical protein